MHQIATFLSLTNASCAPEVTERKECAEKSHKSLFLVLVFMLGTEEGNKIVQGCVCARL